MRKLAFVSLALFGACKWTDFDDLETDAWVHSTEKPDSNSADWGIAMVGGGTVATEPGAGDRLVVLGTSQALYTELNYSPDGSADLAPTELKLNNQFAIATFDPQPILVKDPASDEVSAVTSQNGSLVVLAGVHTVQARQIFNPKSSTPEAAAYVVAEINGSPLSQLIVAADDTVYGSVSMNPPSVQPACALTETDSTPVSVRAIGGVRSKPGDTTDNIVVWSSTGKLFVYPSGVFTADATACPGGSATPLLGFTPVDTGFVPMHGMTQLLVLDNRYVILAGRNGETADAKSSVSMWDLQAGAGLAPAQVGAALERPGQRSSAILQLDPTKRFLALGFPYDSVSGTSSAGQVALYPLSTTTGIPSTPDGVQLSDAQPDSNELFGRSVATFSFNGHQILAVGANNEVFAYYRTSLYDDTRTGN